MVLTVQRVLCVMMPYVPLVHRHMMMKVLLAALVVTVVQVCATRRTPPFSLDKIVACGLDAEDEKPSVVPFIKIEPNELDKNWLPEPIAVDPPRGIIHYQLLEHEYIDRYGMGHL